MVLLERFDGRYCFLYLSKLALLRRVCWFLIQLTLSLYVFIWFASCYIADSWPRGNIFQLVRAQQLSYDILTRNSKHVVTMQYSTTTLPTLWWTARPSLSDYGIPPDKRTMTDSVLYPILRRMSSWFASPLSVLLVMKTLGRRCVFIPYLPIMLYTNTPV